MFPTHSFWSSASTGTAAAELQDDTTASFSEKRHAEKSKKTQLWMKIVKHSNSTWPLKIQAFVFINSSENKLGTLHVVQLFSRISVDLQAEWQLQLDTSALVPGHDSRSQISLVLNVCYNSALLALQVFFSLSFFVATVCTRFAYLRPALLCCQTWIQDNITSFAWTWMVSALLCYQGSTQLRNSEELNFVSFNTWNSKWLQDRVFHLYCFSPIILTFFKPALKDEAGRAEVYKLCKMCKCQKRSSATQIFISPVVLLLES